MQPKVMLGSPHNQLDVGIRAGWRPLSEDRERSETTRPDIFSPPLSEIRQLHPSGFPMCYYTDAVKVSGRAGAFVMLGDEEILDAEKSEMKRRRLSADRKRCIVRSRFSSRR